MARPWRAFDVIGQEALTGEEQEQVCSFEGPFWWQQSKGRKDCGSTLKLWKLVLLVWFVIKAKFCFWVVFSYAYFRTSNSWGFHFIWVFLNIQIISFFTSTPSITRIQYNWALLSNFTMVNSGYGWPVATDQGAASSLRVSHTLSHLQAPCLKFTSAMMLSTDLWRSFHQFGVKCRSKEWCGKYFVKQNLFYIKAFLLNYVLLAFRVLRVPLFY